MKQAKSRSIYLPPETWALIRKRAKKHKMGISRFGWLCCERAVEDASAPAPQPAGHSLVLAAEEQQRLHADLQRLALLGRFTVSAEGGGEATVPMHEVLRFLRLSDTGEEP